MVTRTYWTVNICYDSELNLNDAFQRKSFVKYIKNIWYKNPKSAHTWCTAQTTNIIILKYYVFRHESWANMTRHSIIWMYEINKLFDKHFGLNEFNWSSFMAYGSWLMIGFYMPRFSYKENENDTEKLNRLKSEECQ